jgi:hypothetical protein
MPDRANPPGRLGTKALAVTEGPLIAVRHGYADPLRSIAQSPARSAPSRARFETTNAPTPRAAYLYLDNTRIVTAFTPGVFFEALDLRPSPPTRENPRLEG